MYPMNMLNYKENTYVSYAYDVDSYTLEYSAVDRNRKNSTPPPNA